ncbi:MAG: coenzyme F420-0:L-glutamate ligase / coenzyme F420:gamma-L-glutamate ligase [Bradyrhizobium sp.]|jgi:coenzyme F420-0:L-glutamate ligase/coenzyme F420-1:gamma-L-glutamate ligase|nr:coenzyme F420-0:L-glutamate ligase / coenzyme F420:gamma-L-glutamate ligase [Bradyrhizobium sp.]
MAKSITYFAVPGLPLINPGDDLAALIVDALNAQQLQLVSGDIVVVAQKIASKAENRYVELKDVRPSQPAQTLADQIGKDPRYVEVVLSESAEVVRHRRNILIVAHRLGFVMANAGVDQSNIAQTDAEGRVLLLPRDPDGSAAALKARFDAAFAADIGVIINDSFGRPWRNGVVGVALGVAGVPSLLDMIGAPDLFGRPMQVTEIAVADEIAAGASLLMGQAAEGLPVVVVRGLTFDAAARPASALVRPRERDMFR